jgi:hypothetical protein
MVISKGSSMTGRSLFSVDIRVMNDCELSKYV